MSDQIATTKIDNGLLAHIVSVLAAEVDGAIRDKLIEMGWTPPGGMPALTDEQKRVMRDPLGHIQRSDAWLAVWALLKELDHEAGSYAGSGQDCALEAIRRMHQRAQQPAVPDVNGHICTVPDECETLHWRGQILSMNELSAVAQDGEEIMVNAPHDVYTLPLKPSGLTSGPRFVVHVPAPAQQPAVAQGEMVEVAGRNLRSYLSKASFAMEVDRQAAINCLDVLRSATQQPEFGAPYQGAREDLAIWKRRALEAEHKARHQDQIIYRLTVAMNDLNGPTHMGEPVIAERPAVPEGWRITRRDDCVRVISPDGSTIDVLDDARDPAELMLRDLADGLLSAQPSQGLRQEAPEPGSESQKSPELRDAERYRAWRDALVRNCPEFIRHVEGSLPDAVGVDRRPTAAEWDMAIDAAVDSLRAQAADGEGQPS